MGNISTQEVKNIPKEEWAHRTVQEILVPCSKENTAGPYMDAMDVLAILQRTGRSRLLVTDGDRLAGVVSLKDLLRFLSLKLDLEGESGEDLLQGQSPLFSKH